MHPYLIPPPRLGRTGPRPRSVAERLWRQVRKTETCWYWTGTRLPHGYGTMNIGSYVDDSVVKVYAHRVAYELASGEPIPDDMRVCHDCPEGDDPTCVRNDEPGWHEVDGLIRPKFGHLWLGTQQENIIDSFAKGRGNRAHGAAHVLSKLTPEAVRTIRDRWAADGVDFGRHGLTRASLAAEYRVDKGTISRIIRGDHWSLR